MLFVIKTVFIFFLFFIHLLLIFALFSPPSAVRIPLGVFFLVFFRIVIVVAVIHAGHDDSDRTPLVWRGRVR